MGWPGYSKSNADIVYPIAACCADRTEFKVLSMKTYMCVICGFVYEEKEGLPDEDIAPGTKWEDIPLNWRCPECNAGKEEFEMMEI